MPEKAAPDRRESFLKTPKDKNSKTPGGAFAPAFESIERGDYVQYEGREELRTLANDVKARGHRVLRQRNQQLTCSRLRHGI
jgi:hypothetical protein